MSLIAAFASHYEMIGMEAYKRLNQYGAIKVVHDFYDIMHTHSQWSTWFKTCQVIATGKERYDTSILWFHIHNRPSYCSNDTDTRRRTGLLFGGSL